MAVCRGDEARGDVVAEKGNLRNMGSVLDRQNSTSVAAVLGIAQCRVDAKWDARQINAIPRAKVRNLADEGRWLIES
jgi:hypothetical protein